MFLTGKKIIQEIENGNIEIDPFEERSTNPNSYDVRLDREILVYDEVFLDAAKENKIRIYNDKNNGVDKILLKPNELYLASTIERTFTDKYVPMLEGKSSLARLGVQIHMTAGFGDIGFNGQWTLEISVKKPVYVYAGMKIGQVYFVVPEGSIDILYDGKYQNQKGTVFSKSFKDYNK